MLIFNNLKRFLTTYLNLLISAAIIVAFVSYTIWFDYGWAERTKKRKESEGWIFLSQIKGHWTLEPSLRPWNVFNEPISHLFFTEKNKIFKVKENQTVALIHGVHRDGFVTNVYDSYDLIDCNTLMTQSYNSLKDLKRDSSSRRTQFWSSNELYPKEYFCTINVNEKYSMLDGFGRRFDISNLVRTGKYTIINSQGNLVSILRNNNPYVPTIIDEPVIVAGLLEWFHDEHNLQEVNLPSNLYMKVRYLESISGFNMPMDVYEIELNVDNHLYKPLFWFSKISNPLIGQDDPKIYFI